MKNPFHKGELAVQEKAGVASMASRIGGSIKDTIHPVAQNFLQDIPFVIAASTDEERKVWASPIHGPNGFIKVIGDNTVVIPAKLANDRLLSNIRVSGRLGLLAIEFETRLRMRLNGKASVIDGKILIDAEEVFSNCQKYIQSRKRAGTAVAPARGYPDEGARLKSGQVELIESADTFFIASYDEERGADASHRGGKAGFVKVPNESTLMIPDYSGNNMFQTLGNIEANGKAGLLFIDFKTGDSLQMTGTAEILWDAKDFEGLEGAQRALRFTIEKVVETKAAFPAGWSFIDFSPANP